MARDPAGQTPTVEAACAVWLSASGTAATTIAVAAAPSAWSGRRGPARSRGWARSAVAATATARASSAATTVTGSDRVSTWSPWASGPAAGASNSSPWPGLAAARPTAAARPRPPAVARVEARQRRTVTSRRAAAAEARPPASRARNTTGTASVASRSQCPTALVPASPWWPAVAACGATAVAAAAAVTVAAPSAVVFVGREGPSIWPEATAIAVWSTWPAASTGAPPAAASGAGAGAAAAWWWRRRPRRPGGRAVRRPRRHRRGRAGRRQPASRRGRAARRPRPRRRGDPARWPRSRHRGGPARPRRRRRRGGPRYRLTGRASPGRRGERCRPPGRRAGAPGPRVRRARPRTTVVGNGGAVWSRPCVTCSQPTAGYARAALRTSVAGSERWDGRGNRAAGMADSRQEQGGRRVVLDSGSEGDVTVRTPVPRSPVRGACLAHVCRRVAHDLPDARIDAYCGALHRPLTHTTAAPRTGPGAAVGSCCAARATRGPLGQRAATGRRCSTSRGKPERATASS